MIALARRERGTRNVFREALEIKNHKVSMGSEYLKGDRHSLVFYDWPEQISNADLLAICETFLRLLNADIDYFEVLYSDKSKRRSIVRGSDALIKLRRGMARHAGEHAANFHIKKRVVEQPDADLMNWSLIFDLSLSRETVAMFGWSDEFAGLDNDLLRELSTQFCKIASPVYGLAHTMPQRQGPSYYPQGIAFSSGCSPETMARVDAISRWFDEYGTEGLQRHQSSMLRDVYPFGFLSSFHLQLMVGDLLLERWIKDNEYGRLKQICTDHYVWTLPPDLIAPCRKILTEHKLLIATGPKMCADGRTWDEAWGDSSG